MWILRIPGPIKFCKGPIKISNGPLKFGNLHVFEWDMGHWPILRAHHNFGLGLTLGFRQSVSLITGFSINWSLKRVFLKVHKTFKHYKSFKLKLLFFLNRTGIDII